MEYIAFIIILIFFFWFARVEEIDFCVLDVFRFIMRILGLYGNERCQSDTGQQLASSTASATNINEPFSGSLAEVSEQFKQVGTWFEGRVKLNGVSWKAVCRTAALPPGTVVTVKKLINLSLEVEPKQPPTP